MSNTVDVIDPATFRVVANFPVQKLPQHVVPSWDMRTLYVANDHGNSLTPIDARTGRVGAPIPVDDPYNLYFTPDGTRAIVVAEQFRRLDFRDPQTWRLIRSVDIGHAGPNHLDFTADGKALLISCEFSGWVVRVDVDSMRVTGEVHVGGAPQDMKLSADGTVMYNANMTRGGVVLIDPVAMSEVGFVSTGFDAHGLYPSRDGRSLYVSNRRSRTVSVVDFATRTVTATWAAGNTPDMGGVTADGTQLWLAGRYTDDVVVIDTRTGKVAARIPVGRGPHGLCVFPQPGRYSMGHTGNYR
jgi:YVTN family beta-propeller protein